MRAYARQLPPRPAEGGVVWETLLLARLGGWGVGATVLGRPALDLFCFALDVKRVGILGEVLLFLLVLGWL